MKTYAAILFDLFSTVALWDPARLPRFTWLGESRPSTLGALRTVLAEHAPTVDFADFHSALEATNAALAEERTRNQREIPSRDRFRRSLVAAGLPDDDVTAGVAEALSLQHMALLAGATSIPACNRELLQRLHSNYALALVSNFDHGPTARHILERDGAAGYFRTIVVSDDHGWRKPHPRIFTDTLAQLGVPAQTALFVGDSISDDVIGAQAAGLDVAWVNLRGEPLPVDTPQPDYTIGAIPELAGLLL